MSWEQRAEDEMLSRTIAAMREKLHENQHKPTWRDEDLGWLFQRLQEETDELRLEIAMGDRASVRREAADVANFAGMIIDGCILAELDEPEKLAVHVEARQHKVGLSCSFCGRAQSECAVLIAGPTVYICDHCVSDCGDIIRERDEERRGEEALAQSAGES